MQSRYYNPEWGRFVNADALAGRTGELISHNMFAYCLNNPVNKEDPSGYYGIDIDGIREFVKKAVDRIKDAGHEVNNNAHDWLRQNKASTGLTILFGGAGFVRGATKNAIGLAQTEAGKKLLRKAAIKESTKEALKSTTLGVLTGQAVEIMANPDKYLDNTRFGKRLNVQIEFGRDQINKLIDDPSYIFTNDYWKGEGFDKAYKRVFQD